MCGIAGFFGLGDRQDLEAMTIAMTHRGPDGMGLFVDDSCPVFLGHRRLSIIDLDGGKQPMWNEDGEVGVVFNGEIYNHLELRSLLEAKGHKFCTDHSDTEVLVHGYEEWGEDLPCHLNGMFAFAIYNRRRGLLFLARDRFGEKPLYYTVDHERFIFASELTALACHRTFDAELDKRSIQKLFAYGFLPSPNTIYRNTYKLLPGSSLTYKVGDSSVHVRRYWQYRIMTDDSLANRSEESLAEELRHLLSQAVKRRLMSDVPLGIFLSGGIDSSAILAFVADSVGSEKIDAFSIGFEEPSFDESLYAQRIARELGIKLHQDILSIDRARELIETVMARLDDPFGDGSIIPTYLLSRFTRQGVTVALSGDGGDELFAGYDPFKALVPAAICERLLPNFLKRPVLRLIDLLPISTRNMSLDFRLRRFFTGISFPRELWNPVWLGPLSPNDFEDIYNEPVDVEDVYSEALVLWRNSGADNLLDRSLEFYGNLYLPDDILMKVDRAAMMNSLEVRPPFLDPDLVDFALRLPNRYKIRRGVRKYLLKKALAGILPRDILYRSKKGFGMPVASWLREFPPVPPHRPVLDLNMDWVGRQWSEHRKGKADHRLFLWCWLSLQYHLAEGSSFQHS